MKKKLTTTQVAAMLGVSDQSVANWIDQGQLKAGKTPGGHRRIEKEDLVEFLERQNLKIPDELRPGKPALLIVDDDPAVCEWLSETLQSRFSQCRVMTAIDGYSAGEIVTAENPCVILLDLYMPGLDGFEVCRRIKSGGGGERKSVIGMTAHPSEEAEKQMLAAGAEACIEKPVDLDRLCELIDKALKTKK